MSLHQEMVARFSAFRKALGVPVMGFNGHDGKAIKAMKEYLLELTNQDEERALRGFEFVLNNWKKLTPFQQRMIKPSDMNKYLPEMILTLNPNGPTASKADRDRTQRANLRADIRARRQGGHDPAPATGRPDPPTP